eukprot:2985954-Rhodomonas_salina.2
MSQHDAAMACFRLLALEIMGEDILELICACGADGGCSTFIDSKRPPPVASRKGLGLGSIRSEGHCPHLYGIMRCNAILSISRLHNKRPWQKGQISIARLLPLNQDTWETHTAAAECILFEVDRWTTFTNASCKHVAVSFRTQKGCSTPEWAMPGTSETLAKRSKTRIERPQPHPEPS